MTHKEIKDTCEGLGLVVRQEPETGAQKFSASYTRPGIRVYWWKSSTSDYTLSLPRVAIAGRDTHARSLREIRYLVEVGRKELKLV